MKTHKVIYDPMQAESFTGIFFTGNKMDCENYCKANNNKKGQYFTFIVVGN